MRHSSSASWRRRCCPPAFCPSGGLARGRPMPPRPAYAGAPLAALPSAFDIRRLVPLSDPTADTRWAPVLRATVARERAESESAPRSGSSRRSPRTAPRTSWLPTARPMSDGTTWVRVGLSVLPNDTEGWVPRSSLGGWSFVDTRLVIDRARFTATLYRAGRVIFRARVGVGAPGTPTPAGTVLRARPPERLLQPHVWTARIRHQRALPDAHRLARRRGRGNPRDRPTCPHPWADLPRLRPAYQRRDPQAREAHAGRHSGDDRMSRRRDIVAVITGCCLALGGVTERNRRAGRRRLRRRRRATAPQQLVNAYPLGSSAVVLQRTDRFERDDRLDARRADLRHPPVRTPAPGRARTAGQAGWPPRVRWRVGGAPDRLRRAWRRSSLPAPPPRTGRAGRTAARPRPWIPRAGASCRTRMAPAPAASVATGNAMPRAEPTWDRSPVPPVAASEAEEREFRRLDAKRRRRRRFQPRGRAPSARRRRRARRQPTSAPSREATPTPRSTSACSCTRPAISTAAEAAWRRSAGRGHVRAAANLLFLSRHRRESERGTGDPVRARRALAEFEELSYRRADESGAATGAFNLGAMLHQQGDTAGAIAAYERAERRGDPDAAFNLGVLLYEAGDLDGAEAAWRRSAGRGHAESRRKPGISASPPPRAGDRGSRRRSG